MSKWRGKHGPFLIAEIGGNHEGNFEYAKELTRLALETEVDAVKFQVYYADSLVNPMEDAQRHQHFKRFELSPEKHIELAKMVISGGKYYLASVWDISALQWIDPYLEMYKIGSGDLTSLPIIREFALRGKPIILSTGLSTLDEVLHTVQYIQSVNSIYNSRENLALLQCTSMYPIPCSDANLRVMNTFRKKTDLTIGYSDHTETTKALGIAVAMGAEILEFHFTDNKDGKTFRDHKVSLTPLDIKELVSEIELIREIQGDGVKRPLTSEIKADHIRSFRRGTFPNRDISEGEIISAKDLVHLRPCHGLDPRQMNDVIGMKSPGMTRFSIINQITKA